MKVDVYRNLHLNVWSIRHQGRVIYHTDQVVIENAQFIVQQAGRLRVLKEKQKNVHAFVRGYLSSQLLIPFLDNRFVEITYNPYSYATFVDWFLNPIYQSSLVVLTPEQKCYALQEKK